MRSISTDQAPAPTGHYSQAMVHGGLCHVSGLMANTPDGVYHPGSIEEETEQALANLEAILQAAGSSRDRVLQVRAYITSPDLWAGFNAAFAAHFGEHRPARTVIPVPVLYRGMKVELDAVAAAD